VQENFPEATMSGIGPADWPSQAVEI